MKEICIDARMALHSGIGTYIRNILPYLKKRCVLRVLAPLSLAEKWPALSTYDVIPLEAPLYSVQEQLRLPLKIPSCDIYWTPHYNIPLLPIRAKKRLVTIHDVYHLAFGHTLDLLKRSYAKVFLTSAAFRSDHIITISQFSKDEIVKYIGVSREKITPILNGVCTDVFCTQKTVSSYALPENYFLFVGVLAPHKNLSTLLRAWNLVLQKHSAYHLVLVGKKVKNVDYMKTLKEFPALQSRVMHLENVSNSELPVIYQSAKGFILPSIYEGFGLPPLEAMALKCPTIVSKVGGLPEASSDASLYIDPYNVKDISDKISLLIENRSLRETLIEKGLKRVEECSWEKAALAHLEVINGML